MKLKRILTLGLTLGLAAGLTACKPDSPEERSEWIQKKIQRKLDLNQDQTAKLRQLADAILDAREKVRADRTQTMQAIETLIQSNETTGNSFMHLLIPHMNKVQQEAPAVAEKLAAFNNSLNQEQKTKLLHKFKKHQERHSD